MKILLPGIGKKKLSETDCLLQVYFPLPVHVRHYSGIVSNYAKPLSPNAFQKGPKLQHIDIGFLPQSQPLKFQWPQMPIREASVTTDLSEGWVKGTPWHTPWQAFISARSSGPVEGDGPICPRGKETVCLGCACQLAEPQIQMPPSLGPMPLSG